MLNVRSRVQGFKARMFSENSLPSPLLHCVEERELPGCIESRRARNWSSALLKLAFPLFSAKLRALRNFLGQLFLRSRYLFAIIAGFALAAAFPRMNIAGLAWIAPALMLAAAHGQSRADAFR